MMQRNYSIDIFKLVLSFFVIGLHLHFFEDFNQKIGYFFNQGVFRIAVPIFLLINGYYFEKINNVSQYKKWLLRILFLYGFWMLFYAPLWVSKNFNLNILTLFKGYFHLWYIIGIAYSSILLYKIRNCSLRSIFFITVLLYLIGGLLQYLHAYQVIQIPNFYYRNFLFFCLPFFMMGFIIRKLEQKKEFEINNVYLLISTILFLIEVGINLKFNNFKVGFDILFSFLFLCPILFIAVKKIKSQFVLPTIALVSSAVYFIHPFVFRMMQHFFQFNSIILVILTVLISCLLSLPLVTLNKRIKIL